MTIEEQIDEFSSNLSLLDDEIQKYEYIIELGHELKALDDKYKTDDYKVQGCQSNVWLLSYEKDKKMYFEADSDALIVKGLVYILISIYSDQRADDILTTPKTLLERLGLSQIITSGRQNGVHSVLEKIYLFAQNNKAASMYDLDLIKGKVIDNLRNIYDPEIPVNIYELGLIYSIDLSIENGLVICKIDMTLTSAACPVAESLFNQVYYAGLVVDEIEENQVNVVFDPPWSQDKISFEGKLELGLL